MGKIFGSMILVVGILVAPNAMAIHTCGQMLGSCLVHIDPIVLPKQKPPQAIKVKPTVRRVEPIRSKPKKCFKESGKGFLIQIPCPK